MVGVIISSCFDSYYISFVPNPPRNPYPLLWFERCAKEEPPSLLLWRKRSSVSLYTNQASQYCRLWKGTRVHKLRDFWRGVAGHIMLQKIRNQLVTGLNGDGHCAFFLCCFRVVSWSWCWLLFEICSFLCHDSVLTRYIYILNHI